MKTIRIMLVVLAISAITFVACQKEETPLDANTETGLVQKPWNMISYKGIIERLEHYDKTRKPVLEQALGFEDTRINYYSIETIENYINYVKQLSKEKGIEFTGINFVSGAYPEDANYGTPKYQHIMFMPTTEIDGKQIGFDPVQSSKEKVVTIKEMLASYGYNWIYDSKEDYDNRNKQSKSIQQNFKKRGQMSDIDSGTANVTTVGPPMPND